MNDRVEGALTGTASSLGRVLRGITGGPLGTSEGFGVGVGAVDGAATDVLRGREGTGGCKEIKPLAN